MDKLVYILTGLIFWALMIWVYIEKDIEGVIVAVISFMVVAIMVVIVYLISQLFEVEALNDDDH